MLYSLSLIRLHKTDLTNVNGGLVHNHSFGEISQRQLFNCPQSFVCRMEKSQPQARRNPQRTTRNIWPVLWSENRIRSWCYSTKTGLLILYRDFPLLFTLVCLALVPTFLSLLISNEYQMTYHGLQSTSPRYSSDTDQSWSQHLICIFRKWFPSWKLGSLYYQFTGNGMWPFIWNQFSWPWMT